MHRGEVTLAFFFFGVWGCVALIGTAASVHTYFESGDPPDRPPKGGLPVRGFAVLEGGKAPLEARLDHAQRAA